MNTITRRRVGLLGIAAVCTGILPAAVIALPSESKSYRRDLLGILKMPGIPKVFSDAGIDSDDPTVSISFINGADGIDIQFQVIGIETESGVLFLPSHSWRWPRPEFYGPFSELLKLND